MFAITWTTISVLFMKSAAMTSENGGKWMAPRKRGSTSQAAMRIARSTRGGQSIRDDFMSALPVEASHRHVPTDDDAAKHDHDMIEQESEQHHGNKTNERIGNAQ